jgi:hypothetical protein
MVSDQLLRKWKLVQSLSGDCSSRLRGHFHADATFSVSTLNYRISMRRGNINVVPRKPSGRHEFSTSHPLTVKGIVSWLAWRQKECGKISVFGSVSVVQI